MINKHFGVMGVAKQRYSGHGIALGRVSDALGEDISPLLGV